MTDELKLYALAVVAYGPAGECVASSYTQALNPVAATGAAYIMASKQFKTESGYKGYNVSVCEVNADRSDLKMFAVAIVAYNVDGQYIVSTYTQAPNNPTAIGAAYIMACDKFKAEDGYRGYTVSVCEIKAEVLA